MEIKRIKKGKDIIRTFKKVHKYNFKIILIYLSVTGRERNIHIKGRIENILRRRNKIHYFYWETSSDTQDSQRKNRDVGRKVILDWLDRYDLAMLSGACQCEGVYTWLLNNMQSGNNYMLISGKNLVKNYKCKIILKENV